MFDTYLSRWNLIPDGSPIVTQSGRLLPVRRRGEPAMLNLLTEEEEHFGVTLMEWWDGDGAARVLARDPDALLLERAEGVASLADMARNGRDDEACRVLCAVAARLHASRPKPLPGLVPLAHWFRELEPSAATHGGILVRCAETAQTLLAEPREPLSTPGQSTGGRPGTRPGDNGEAPLARPGHALAKRMRLAEGHRARQRDSRDRLTGLRLAATTVRAIPTPSPGQRKCGSISASPAKRSGCSERCIRNLAARQR